jgi:Ser/Thr protein kinase RdoA (MazF antagonist)
MVIPTPEGHVVLKRYPSRWPIGSIVYEHDILRHLAAAGFPATRVRSADDGSTFATVRGHRFAVFAFDAGRSLRGRPLGRGHGTRFAVVLGAVLAELHTVLDGFHPLGRHHVGRLTPIEEGDLDSFLRTIDELAGRPAPDGKGSPLWRRLVDRVEWITTELPPLHRMLAGADLPRSVIHADFGPHNVAFRSDGSAVVHDFELAHEDRRLVDLVIVLSRSGTTSGRAMIDGYRSRRTLDGDGWALLGEVWVHHRLVGAIRSWDSYARHGDERRLRAALARLDEAERISSTGVRSWGSP